MLKLDSIFQNNMVLPIGKSFKITGITEANARIVGEFLNRRIETDAHSNGSFSLRFDPVLSEKTVVIKIRTEKECVNLQVQFGKVYLFSGQSNVEFRLKDADTYQSVLDDFPTINAYFFEVPQIEYVYVNGEVKPENIPTIGTWKKITPKTCGEMSAVAFYAVVQMQKNNNAEVIGIVDCYKGGTSASSWIPYKELRSSEELFNAYIVPFEKSISGKSQSDYQKELSEYKNSVETHNRKLNNFMKKNPNISLSEANNIVGHTPWPPPLEPTSYLRPGGLYKTMVTKILPYTFNGIVWYQGENDANHPELYTKLLNKLVSTWRRELEDYSLPIKILQLPRYEDEPEDAWAKIRQAQLQIANTLPYVDLISLIDTGDRHNIHPTHKCVVGERVGKYLQQENYPGTPIPKILEWNEEKLVILVRNANTLKTAKNVSFKCLNGVQEELICPKIIKNKLVFNKNIEEVAYQYSNYTQPTIFNEIDEPLAAFKIKRGEKNYGLRIN